MARDNTLLELENLSWLSDLVRTGMREQYPQLVSVPWHQRLISFLLSFLKLPAVWACLVFVIFLFGNEQLVSHGFTLATYDLDAQAASDVMASFIDSVAAMLGIVIPLIILLIEFLGRESSDVIDIYLDKTQIRTTALLTLVVLALHILTELIVRTESIPSRKFYFHASVLLLLLDLAVLVGVGSALNRVRQSLSNDFRIQAFLEHIHQETRKSQRNEVEYRYSRNGARNIGNSLGFVHAPFMPKVPGGATPLVACKAGVITDIHLAHWKELAQSLTVVMDERLGAKGYTVKTIGDFVEKDAPVVYVALEEHQDVRILQQKLDQSLKIEGLKSSRRSEISRFLQHLKRITRTAILEQNDDLFGQFLDVYLDIFQMGMGLHAPPTSSAIPGIFSGWSVISTIAFHLNDIIEVSAQSSNESLIHMLASRLSIVVEEVIGRNDTYISESLPDILRLFGAIYSCSRLHANRHGVRYAFSYLTGSVVDHAWIGKFERVYNNRESLDNLIRLLYSILNVLSNMVHSMLSHHDPDSLGELLNKLQPIELLARFDVVARQIDSERWDLKWQLGNVAKGESKKDLEAQLAVRELALSIPNQVGDYFNELVFMAASYIVEGYELEETDTIRAKELLDVLKSYFPSSLKELVNVFSRLISPPGSIPWSPFHRRPDTKRVYSTDDKAKFYLFYCLEGCRLLSEQDLQEELPTFNLEHRLRRIEQICESIAKAPDRWTSILGIDTQDIPAAAAQFADLNEKIVQQWKRDREEQIISADLDPEKVAAFQASFEETRSTSPNLHSLLKKHGKVLNGVRVAGRFVWDRHVRIPYKERFTSLHPDPGFAKQHGQECGRELVWMENFSLQAEWLKNARTVRTRKDWTSLEPYLERALDYMRKNGYAAQLIIIPSSIIRYQFLHQLPKFENVHSVESPPNLPGLRGFYNKIPVLQPPRSPVTDHILVVDIEKASQLEIEYIEAEVSPLPKAERERILEKDPDLTERELQLSIRVRTSEKAKVRILDKSAIVKLPIKLPRERLAGG